MKLNEKNFEKKAKAYNPTPRYELTKAGLYIESKDYVQYLKESEYKESYKKFWSHFYLEHKYTEHKQAQREGSDTKTSIDERRHRKY